MIRSTHKRFIAALLPLSFLLTVAACVSICERESSSTHRQMAYPVALTDISSLPDCGGCPFISSPKATTPEREKYIQTLQPVERLVAGPIYYSNNDIAKGRLSGPSMSDSPPLHLLLALRI
jgi:hypothetical protein